MVVTTSFSFCANLLNDQSIVATPAFTSNNKHQGPWPDCYFQHMTLVKCEEYIHVFAPDVHTEVLYPGDEDDKKSLPGIDVERVKIFVNETGYVIQTPGRG
jgi:hypothetical protein